jgi:uncharacterized protein
MIDDTEIIDFHGHVGEWDIFDMHDDADKIIHAMDAGGIDRSCLFNIFHPDGTTGNDQTAAFVSQHPDRFIGFAYVSPLMPERMVAELERAIDVLNFSAIKIYPPYVPWPMDEPVWDPIYQLANERGLAVITHTGSEETCWPVLVGKVAARFPDANFVIGHSGNAEPYRTQAIEAAQQYENVYLETCSTFREPGVVERLVNEAGADRVLFGSDVPLMDPRTQLGKIITADITDDQKRLVLGANARRLLKL